MADIAFRLYAVADEATCDAPDVAERAAALAELGGKHLAIYVRDDRAASARKILGATAAYSTPVFVRRAAMASAGADASGVLGATGIHLRESELGETGIFRRVRKTDAALLTAASVHDVAQTIRARDAACAFVVFGHVFATPGKAGLPPRGVGALASCCAAAEPMPVFAIGGITPAHVGACLEAGAFGVAAVRGLFGFPDPRPMLEAYLEALGTS